MADSNISIDNNVGLVPGVTNRITGKAWATKDSDYFPSIDVEGLGIVWTGTPTGTWEDIDISVIPTGTRLRLRSDSVTPADWQYVYFDEIEVTVENTLLTKDLSLPYEGLRSLKISCMNLLSDGDMEEVGIGSWVQLGGTIVKTPTDPKGGLLALLCGTAIGYQSVLTIGNKYRAVGFAASSDGTPPRLDANHTVWTGTSSTSWQKVFVEFIATDTAIYLVRGVWDNVSVIDITNGWIDGKFEEPTLSAYNLSTLATLSLEPTGGDTTPQWMKITLSGVGDGYGYQADVIDHPTKEHRLQAAVKSDGLVLPRIFNGPDILWTGTLDTAWQDVDITFEAALSNFDIRVGILTGTTSHWIGLDHLYISPIDIDPQVVPAAVRDQTLTKGYNLTGRYYGDGQAVPLIKDGDRIVWTGVASTSWTYFEFIYLAQNAQLKLTMDQLAGFIKFDDMVLLEYA